MKSTIKFQHSNEDLSISFESQGVTTDEVMEHFVQFMLAMGYARESIYEAMRELLEEHEDYLKSCAKAKAEPLLSLD
jgi:DNA-binding transcriptional regulator YhcF (GntR family)